MRNVIPIPNPASWSPPFRLQSSIQTLFSLELLLLAWFALSPIASFFIRYPAERSIITFDRAVFATAIFVAARRALRAKTLPLVKLEIFWALVSVLAVVSAVAQSFDIGAASKTALDSFLLPLAAFHIARRHLDLRRKGPTLILLAMWLAAFLFATGAYEYLTGSNLFPYKGSELVREGELRVNGPFASDSSYAVICLMVALFVRAAPAAVGARLDKSARLLYVIALASAALACLLPLFRVVAAALVICWALYSLAGHPGWLARVNAKTLGLLAMIALLFAIIGWQSLERRLADPRNIYGRVATWQTATKIALENPLLGVGLGNYTTYFQQTYVGQDRLRESVLDARAAASPHSNLLWIASELGLAASVLYLMANVYIFLAGYRAFKRARSGSERRRAACYLAIAFAYWIPGLTLTSGAYSDLNLYFFFLLGLLLNGSAGKHERERGGTPDQPAV